LSLQGSMSGTTMVGCWHQASICLKDDGEVLMSYKGQKKN
jgi:hypothetical protein